MGWIEGKSVGFGTISSSLAATAPSLDVSAWFAHLEADYNFHHPWSLRLAKGRFLRDAPNAPRGGDTLYNSFNATVSF